MRSLVYLNTTCNHVFKAETFKETVLRDEINSVNMRKQ